MKMRFGAYKGLPVSQLPQDYLEWLLTIAKEPLRSAVRAELADRRNPARPDLQLAKQVIDCGFRSLALRFHPDKGGDLKTMQRLNCTTEWLRQQIAEVLT